MSGNWNPSVPTTGTFIVHIPRVHSNNWLAIESTFTKEHTGWNSTPSGTHRAGATTTITAAGSAAILGITSASKGAIGWDTDVGTGWLYTGSAWTPWSSLPGSRVIAYPTADYSVPATAAGTPSYVLPFGTEVLDTLGEFDTATSTFTASGDGYYLLSANLTVLVARGGINLAVFFSVTPSAGASTVSVGLDSKLSISGQEIPFTPVALCRLARGGTAQLSLAHNYTSDVVLEGGQEKSSLKIHKLS